MPDLRTDDGPRKLRAVWLGPNGATFPFQWTYVQWAVTLLAVPATIGLFGLILTVVGLDPFTVWAFAMPWGGALAIFVVIKVMAGVSFDRPLRYHRRLLAREWRNGEVAETALQRVGFAPPSVRYLSPRMLKTMDWLSTDQVPANIDADPEPASNAADQIGVARSTPDEQAKEPDQ